MIGTIKEKGAGGLHPHQDVQMLQHEVKDDILQVISSSIPFFAEKFDPHAYIDWELNVDKEFGAHDLSEKEKIYIASSVLTESALLEWKYICRHNKVLES